MLVFIDTEVIMIINTLEHMEKIVQSNKSLSWEGWNVVHSYPSDKARTSKFGAYTNRGWIMKKVYIPSRQGWDIPNKFVE